MTRRIARPLLSGIFLAAGVNALRKPDALVPAVEQAGISDPEKAVRVHGATNLVGGLMLATNKVPRLAALGLAANLVPSTYVQHPFWAASPETKQQQQSHFLKNLGLLGGLLLAAADTGGRESIPHKMSRVSKRTAKDAGKAQEATSKKARREIAQAQKQAAKRAEVLSR